MTVEAPHLTGGQPVQPFQEPTPPAQPPVAVATPGAGIRVEWAPVPKVNLLPAEIVDARAFRGVQRVLVGAVAGTVVAAGLAFAWALHGVSTAQRELDASQARTAQLRTEEARYADVPRVLAQVQKAKSARSVALGNDVLWYRFFDDLAAATPDTVSLKSVSVTLAATSAAPVAGANPLSPNGIGTVTVTGGGERFPDVANWLESVVGVDGLDASTLQSVTRTVDGPGSDSSVNFSSSVVVDADALSHRFDGKAG